MSLRESLTREEVLTTMTANEVTRALDAAIQSAGSKVNYRKNKLPPEAVIRLLIGMEGGSLARELHRAGVNVTPSAFSQAREKVPPEIFYKVFCQFNRRCADSKTFFGYRLLAVDGSSINIPRNPHSPSFICNNSAPNGYNQLHLNPLYDLCNLTFYDALIQPEPQKDEIGALIKLLARNEFPQKTIIVADRGYESYNMLAHLQNKANVDFVVRLRQNRSAMREIARLPMVELDTDISFTVTTTQTNEDKARGYIHIPVSKRSKPESKTRQGRWDFPSPYTMRLRIVRFRLPSGEFETIATSLPRTFTMETIKELYHMRWGIEVSFRDLKYAIGLVNLHGKRDAYAEQEIYAALTMFNYTSRMAALPAVRGAYKVNYAMAVKLCREFFRAKTADGDALVSELARHTVPLRPGRADPRNLRAKGFVGFTYRVAS